VLRAPKAVPIPRGSAVVFWWAACGIDLGAPTEDLLGFDAVDWGDPPNTPRVRRVYRTRERWFAYEKKHMHGSHLYRVHESELEEDFPRVLERLEQDAGKGKLLPHVEKAFAAWQKRAPRERDGVRQFIDDVRQAHLDYAETRSAFSYYYALSSDGDFQYRWVRARWYWAAVAFEGLYLGGLVLFFFWPLLRNQGRLAWACRVGALPFLVMLPVYLGYASNTYSSDGPQGSIVYPWIIVHIQGNLFSSLDRNILFSTPPILESLSPLPGPMVSISWRRFPGPLTTAIIGLVSAAALLALPRAFALWRRHRSPTREY